MCVFYNISVYLSPKKDGYCRFKQKTMTRKQTGKIVLTLLLASCAFGRVQAQMVVRANRQVQFEKTLPAGNYSGMSHLADNLYMLADDKYVSDGYRLVEIETDSVSGQIEKVVDKGFVVGANNKNRDAEGVAFLPHRQSVMVVGEADSMIKEYSLDGKAEGRQLQLEKGVGNGGYESLAYDGSRGLLFTCTESPLPEDLQTDDNEPWRFRIQAIDESSLKVLGSWLYVADKPVGKAYKAGNYAFGISELTALDNNKVLVLERECYVPKKKIGAWVRNKIYCVTLSKNHGFSENLYGSTQAVDKTLVYEWKTKMNLTARSFANYEGMCLGPTLTDGSRTLLLCADSQNQAHGVLKDWFMSLVIR